jgi:hypothetical protein
MAFVTYIILELDLRRHLTPRRKSKEVSSPKEIVLTCVHTFLRGEDTPPLKS